MPDKQSKQDTTLGQTLPPCSSFSVTTEFQRQRELRTTSNSQFTIVLQSRMFATKATTEVPLMVYLLYRIVQWLMASVQELLWHLTGVNEDGRVRLLNIRAKVRRNIEELPIEADFLYTHAGFCDYRDEILSDPNWTLYAFTRSHVYFVRLPADFNANYHAKEQPFAYTATFLDANRLARMAIHHFVTLTPKGRSRCTYL